MIKRLSVLLLIGAFLLSASAQDCSFFPMIEGATFESTTYTANGKPTTTTSTTVSKVSTISGGLAAQVSSQIDGKEMEEKVDISYAVKCVNGELQMNLSDIFSGEAMKEMMGNQGIDIDMKVESDNLIFPSRMDIGQTLPDAKMNMEMKAMGMEMNFTTLISQRKVEKQENLTTPAGTFTCYKMTFLTTTDGAMGISMQFKTAAWYNDKVGMVRTEEYDQSGTLNSYTELTAFSE
ncbi:MAG: hypothetical protein AAF824_10680 [Bacteroidota bacterium]